MYKVVYRKSAIKTLEKLPKQLSNHFMLAFRQIANGTDDDLDIKKLTGREGFRLRIGNYRAIYQKLNDVMVIEVINIGSRGDVYK